MQSPTKRPADLPSIPSADNRLYWLGPLFVCAGLNVLFLVGIASWNWPYLVDEHLVSNPDARHYILLGKNLLAHGAFSRSSNSPFVPDLLRTPGFPVLIAALWKLGGVAAIFVATAALQVVDCGLLYVLTNKIYGPVAALFASLLLATDLMITSYNFSAMAENPFVTPLLAGVLLLVSFVADGCRERSPSWKLVASGALIGVATLVRPTSLYLGLLLGAMLLAHMAYEGRLRAAVAAAVTLVSVSLLVILPWIARNQLTFGVPKMTTVDTNNLVYFVGASGYQLKRGIPLTTAQEQIAAEYSLPKYDVAQNAWVADISPAEIERRLGAAAPQILARYPLHLLAACAIGVAKATVSHSVEFTAEIFGMHWQAPGFANLVRLDRDAWHRLFQNNLLLVASFGWQLAHVLVAIGAGLVGIFAAWRQRSTRFASLLVLVVFGYLYATIAMFGMDAFFRCRIPAMPFLYVFSGLGLATLLAAWRGRPLLEPAA